MGYLDVNMLKYAHETRDLSVIQGGHPSGGHILRFRGRPGQYGAITTILMLSYAPPPVSLCNSTRYLKTMLSTVRIYMAFNSAAMEGYFNGKS
jgi:hypothetical protein